MPAPVTSETRQQNYHIPPNYRCGLLNLLLPLHDLATTLLRPRSNGVPIVPRPRCNSVSIGCYSALFRTNIDSIALCRLYLPNTIGVSCDINLAMPINTTRQRGRISMNMGLLPIISAPSFPSIRLLSTQNLRVSSLFTSPPHQTNSSQPSPRPAAARILPYYYSAFFSHTNRKEQPLLTPKPSPT